MKKTVLFCEVAMLVFVILTGCGKKENASAQGAGTESPSSSYPKINNGQPITLRIAMQPNYLPTLNKVPTPESPEVVLAADQIADEFRKIHPNVTIEYDRSMPPMNALEAAEWFTTQIAGGTCPAVAFTWNWYTPRGWYADLTDVMETPNEYVPGNKRWRDQFPEYIWNKNNNTDLNKRVQAVPIWVAPGPLTAYFYNVDLFKKFNLEPPKTWEDLRHITKTLKDNGYTSLLPFPGNQVISTDLWPIYFSIGPCYSANLMDTLDYDKDGIIAPAEELRGVKANVHNPVIHEYAREVLYLVKEMLAGMYPKGFEHINLDDEWNSGNTGMKQGGSWTFQAEASNTKRSFEFGLTPAPIVTSETSKYVAKIEFTEAGPYQPDNEGLNVMKPAVEKNQAMFDAAVAYLKFLTNPEIMSQMILEKAAHIGSVYGCAIPPLLEGWLNRPFPMMPNVGTWPRGWTTEGNEALGRELELWIKDITPDDAFFARWNQLQQEDADRAIRDQNVDTSGWK
ncbi:MAG: extracellular solute-binding protein [Treponema sp.]|jgi:ABC-type glycerol-3-phosphate transport system substrate-binding protein|nr:extracellular solute-binding protein [Treponema sp.]